MKKVVSISLGSSERDHQVQVRLGEEDFIVCRQGTDGDFELLKKRLAEMNDDPEVAAIGLGGADLFLNAAGRTYWFREMKPLAKIVTKKAFVDGSGLKGEVEADTVRYMQEDLGVDFSNKKVMVTSAVDRWGLAMGFEDAGIDTDFADLYFILGVRKIIHSARVLTRAIRIIAPVAINLPFSWLYPSEADHTIKPATNAWTDRMYHDYDYIAGDYKLIIKNMPADMRDTWVITNTTTSADIDFLKAHGVKNLITTSHRLEGRSFGANVMEALLVASEGKKEALTPECYLRLMKKYDLGPELHDLSK
ncbi:MAG: quinate 5-dehydrogenase [Coriobacteriia bacterium]|nr:quinate 5-dehydrogenase [Coriobacteriia bacterium]